MKILILFFVQFLIIPAYGEGFVEDFGYDTSEASPIFGSHDASVTIIEFGDYQCTNCAKWYKNTKPDIVTNYIDPGKVNLVFVDLAFIGKDSFSAAQATYCANDQGKFWDFHNTLYSNQGAYNNGWASPESLRHFAEQNELDMEKFEECFESGKYKSRISYNLQISQNNKITSTPGFIIVNSQGESKTIRGPQPYSVFEKVIESLIVTTPEVSAQIIESQVPDWIKNNAKWWSEDQIDDQTFVNSIQFLIKQNIIEISSVGQSNDSKTSSIPNWVKNTALWWADGAVSENEFLNSITFLVKNGIIVVN